MLIYSPHMPERSYKCLKCAKVPKVVASPGFFGSSPLWEGLPGPITQPGQPHPRSRLSVILPDLRETSPMVRVPSPEMPKKPG